MNITVDVIRKQDDGLARQMWKFWFHEQEMALVLDIYQTQFLPSRRHSMWQTQTQYIRREARYTTHRLEDVPLPTDVLVEAKEKFMATMNLTPVKRAMWGDLEPTQPHTEATE